MTQQEIVDAVNRLTVGYNVSWADIKTDADKAIYKINSYLGASYPLMSSVLNSPFASYALKYHGKYIPIFGDQYITSIVIPFIASEILSRDEEFTTIYNKYLLEVEDGLFTMFSNEFNRVPHVFRQPDTTGVFFAEGMPQKPLECCNVQPFPKFRINYHLNNNSVLITDSYVDTTEYEYGQSYNLIDLSERTPVYYSADGIYKYTLEGWYTDPTCTTEAHDGVILSDLDIYANWERECTLSLSYTTIQGIRYTVPILKAGNSAITNLSIPEYIDGRPVTAITGTLLSNYTINLSSIKTITIPKSVVYINEYAFEYFTGTDIIFPNDPTLNITIASDGLFMPRATMGSGAYKEWTLTIPKSIKTLPATAFSSAGIPNGSTTGTTREIYVYCEFPYIAKPTTFLPNTTRITHIVCDTVVYKIFYNGD